MAEDRLLALCNELHDLNKRMEEFSKDTVRLTEAFKELRTSLKSVEEEVRYCEKGTCSKHAAWRIVGDSRAVEKAWCEEHKPSDPNIEIERIAPVKYDPGKPKEKP